MLPAVFAVPVPDLPDDLRDAVPDGVGQVAFAGRAVVGAAFLRYQPGGVLAYSELLLAVLGRGRLGQPRWSIGQIWVDSPTSRTGGKELWAVPKELGAFEWAEASGVVRCRLVGIAEVKARLGRALTPCALPAPLVVAQHRSDRAPVLTRSLIMARPRAVRSRWRFVQDGPLGYLVGRRPLTGVAFRRARVTFGSYVSVSRSRP
jgi:hypothetical protein